MNFTFKLVGVDAKPVYGETETEIAIAAGEQLDPEGVIIEHMSMVTNPVARTARQDVVFKRDGVVVARATAEALSVLEFYRAMQRGYLWTP